MVVSMRTACASPGYSSADMARKFTARTRATIGRASRKCRRLVGFIEPTNCNSNFAALARDGKLTSGGGAEVRGVGLVSRSIIEHRVDRGRQRRQRGKAGENGAITDLAVDHEGRTLRDFQRIKLDGACSHPRFNRG